MHKRARLTLRLASAVLPALLAIDVQAQQAPLEAQAEAFVRRYYADWSLANPAALAAMDTAYADRVEFYGGSITRDALITEKRRFAERWPARRFTVRDSSLKIACAPQSCTANGIVEWLAESADRSKTSHGFAQFVLEIAMPDARITVETGKVIKDAAHEGAKE